MCCAVPLFCATVLGRRLIGHGLRGAKLIEEALAVAGDQRLDPLGIGGADDEPGVVVFLHAERDLGIVVVAGVGLLLAGETDDAASVVLAQRWQSVRLGADRCDLDTGPLNPGIETRGEFNDIGDVGSSDACRRFQKVESAIGVGLDELGVGNAGDHSQRCDDLLVDDVEMVGFAAVAGEGASTEDATLMHGLHGRGAVFVGCAEEYLTLPGDSFDVIDVTGDEAL